MRRVLRRGAGALTVDAALALVAISLAAASPWHDAPSPPPLVASDAAGAVTLTNSRAGKAIFSGRGLRPGASAAGAVTIGNPGPRPLTVFLASTVTLDSPGAGGGRLGSRVQLQVLDVTRRPAVAVYAARLAALRTVRLGAFAAGERRRYSFLSTLPIMGPADNAVQGATLINTFTWTATAVTMPTPVPTPPTAPPAPAAPAPPVVSPVQPIVALPSPRGCLSRRRFVVALHPPAGTSIARVTVEVSKAKPRRYGRVAQVPVDLRHRGRGAVKVNIAVTLSDGRRVTVRRTFRPCGRRR